MEDRAHEAQIIQTPPPNPLFMFVPVIIERLELDPFEYRLWMHYWGGAAKETIQDTAHACQMSVGKVLETREKLSSIGLVSLVDRNGATVIALTDMWAANAAWVSSNSLLGARDWLKLYWQGKAPAPQPTRRAKGKLTPSGDAATGVRLMQSALLQVTGRDMHIQVNWVSVAPTAKQLLEAGYTPEQVKTCYGEGGWWFKADWRGLKGQKPSVKQILETIKEAVEGKVPTTGFKRGEPSPVDMNIQSSLLSNIPVGID